jgi:nitrous oxidase accessory protein
MAAGAGRIRAEILMILAAAALALTLSAADPHVWTPANLEGRPASPGQTSPLQARVDAAAPGDTLRIESGRFDGDLIVDRPLRLIGVGRPLLVGSGTGSVVRIRAADVTIEGFDIDGRGGGDLGRDPSGIHVAAPRATIRDCRIRGSLFGIYLREAPGSVIESCSIRGIKGKTPGEKGSGIHIWNTVGFRCERNEIADARDGFYIQASSQGRIAGNVARDLRYGLHFMFSDDNVFEDNLFENGAAGSAIMYSRRITFSRNRFLRNRGFASVGLLFKSCEDVTARDNLIADNARGIFLEGTSRGLFSGNVVAGSDAAIVLYDSCSALRFTGNAFLGNLTPLALVGRRTDTSFDGNYWSDNDEPDLDGDGRSDRPYRLSSVFDHIRGNLSAADLFSQGIGASALGMAERAFPVLSPVTAEDRAALSRPPSLPRLPASEPAGGDRAAAGMGSALALLAAGSSVFWGGRRRP